MALGLCKDCKHFETETPYRGCHPEGFGHCGRWHEGYHVATKDLAPNEVLVESDEGWGNIVGAEFGCVLHEVKKG